MTVKVVTDSTGDIPPGLVKELGITVIPLQVNFGLEEYRDGVDLTADQFYEKLASSRDLPTTSTPSVGEFTKIYNKLAEDGSQIVSVHISSKLSATFNTARLASADLRNIKIDVIDSENVSMATGIAVIKAAQAARRGASLEEVGAIVRSAVKRVYLLGLLDTLKYVQKGGRIGRAQALLGHMLDLKPMLTIKDGEVYPVEKVRTRRKALDRMLQLALAAQPFEEVVIMHSTGKSEADWLAEQISSVFPKERMYFSRFGPVLGTHIGPGAVGLGVLLEGKSNA